MRKSERERERERETREEGSTTIEMASHGISKETANRFEATRKREIIEEFVSI
jgi:hypothetical protein